MPNKPNPEKCFKGIRVPIELDFKVTKEWSRKNDRSDTDAYIRALEEATRNVVLTVEDHRQIMERVEANIAKNAED